ncbi:MAG TPA: hypothetical protein VHR72_05645 [Gemmataceae bacterium]|jgi:hypothetical protein|nr:hypothetical protein [Gemmataceae bacterium]
MRGSSRWLLAPGAAVLGLVLFALPAVPAWALPQPKLPPEATDKPSVVVRVRAVGELLKDARAVAKLVDQEAMFDNVEPALGQVLGAIDTTKPIGFYALIKAEPVNSIGVLMVPVKNAKDLLDVIGTVANPTEKDGLYTVNAGIPFSILFRFHGGYAYATVRNSKDAEAALDKNKIYAPSRIFEAKDASLVSATFNLDAIPNGLKQKALDHIDEFLRNETLKHANEPSPQKELATTIVTEVAKRAQMFIADALTAKIRLDFDRTKETMGATFRLAARKDTALANEIARNTTGQGLGEGLLSNPSAVKVAAYAVLPDALKKTLDPLVDKLLSQVVAKAEALQNDAKDVADALAPTLKSGLLDIGFDLRGPNADGFASMLFGIRLVDGDKLEPALRRFIGNIGARDRKDITFDVAKVDGVSIHRIAPKDLPKEEFRDLVGPDAKVFVAMRKNLLVVGIGSQASTLAAMRDALKAGPKTCKVLEGEVAIRNLAKLIEKKREGTVDAAAKAFPAGTDDTIRYSVSGGETAEFRVTSSIRMILFSMLTAQLQNR